MPTGPPSVFCLSSIQLEGQAHLTRLQSGLPFWVEMKAKVFKAGQFMMPNKCYSLAAPNLTFGLAITISMTGKYRLNKR